MKVLVTGAYGNIGQFIVKELLRNEHQVVALDIQNPSTKLAEKQLAQVNVTSAWVDLQDKQGVQEALKGVDAVVHMAAIIPPLSENNNDLANNINVLATSQLIELMEASETAKRLVFASSMGIYGKNQTERTPPLKVDDAPSPGDYYGETKVEAEALVKKSSLQWSILRLAACPPVNLSSARSHKGNNPFEFHPKSRVEIIHPEDAGNAFARAVDREAAIGKTFFIGGGKSCQLHHYELASRTLQAAGLSLVKESAFKDSGKLEMYGDWLETADGEAILKYQKHSPEDFFNDFKSSLGFAYYFIRLIAPVATWFLVKKDGFDNNLSQNE